MIKKIIEFTIDKSILNHLFLLFLIVVSIFSYIKIPKEIFPPSTLDAIVINGFYSGASPDILDKMVVRSIEDELQNIADIDSIESTIKNGRFTIKANLKRGSDNSKDLDDVKDIISKIKNDLPSDMNEPTAKIFEKLFPLVTISVSADVPKEELLKMADRLKKRFSKIKDLSDIEIYGDSDKELNFYIDEKKLLAYNISRSQLITALSNLSSIFPIGFIKERGKHLFVSTINGEKDIEKIKNTFLSVAGKKIRVKDVCEVKFELSDADRVSHYNGVKNVSLNINKSKSGNAIALVKEIRKILKEYKEKYKNYQFGIYTDTSIWIRNRLNTVISNILFGLILVSASIYFLVNGQIALVVAMGIPVSFMIGLISANLLGYSINMLSLLGVLIALGMLVDEAIVVAENIYSHLERGDDPKTAAINGAYEMFPAVLTATSTTIFAFLPLLIMSGEMGLFIRILPIMISILLISSLFEAFFFLPLHAKEFLHITKDKGQTKNEKFWRILRNSYSRIISFFIKYRKSFLFLFLSIIIYSTFLLMKNAKFQLFPEFDNTQIYISGKVDVNFKLEETQEIITEMEKILLKKLPKEDVDSITSVSGMRLNAKFLPEIGENHFHIFVNLHERAPEDFFNKYINPYLSPNYDDSDMIRKKSAKEIAKEINRLIANIKKDKRYEEIDVIVPSTGIVKSDIEISFSGDIKKVKKAIKEVEERLKREKYIYNINNDLELGEKELKLKVNSYGASLGFNEKIVASLLRPYFFKAEISKMFYNGELIKIKSQELEKDIYQTFKNFYVDIPNSFQKVKISEIVDFQFKDSYSTIYKEDSKRIRTLYASMTKGKITSKEVLSKLKAIFEKIREEGVEIIIKGEAKANRQVGIEMGEAGLIAIFLIFIALVWMFNSIALPLIILSTIPLSIFGVLIGNLIMGINLTMPGVLGIVGLSGVVVNDGIIMIDFIKKAKSREEFIEFATSRLRPILLTSLTTVLGLSTLIFFAFGQAVILQPMAISLGFGITWATILNLYYVPLFYYNIYGSKIEKEKK